MSLINKILLGMVLIMACVTSYLYGYYQPCEGEIIPPLVFEREVEKDCPDTIGVLNPCDQGELECAPCARVDYEVYEKLALSEEMLKIEKQICNIQKQLIIKDYEEREDN